MSSFVVSAPGKVIIHGEHAVVYGKKALAASLNLRTFMKVTKREDGKLTLNLPNIALSGEWRVDELPRHIIQETVVTNPDVPSPDVLNAILEFLKFDRDTHDTKNLAAVLFIYFYMSLLLANDAQFADELGGGLSISAASSIPPGAGLGSSAAFSVCLAAALLQLSGGIKEPQKLDDSELAAWSDHDLGLINKWAFVGEKVIHGNASGIDNSVSCYGGIFKFQKGSLERLTAVRTLNILLTNTKVPRTTRAMVAKAASRNQKYPDVIGPILASIEAISDTTLGLLTTDSDTEADPYEHLEGLIGINQHLLAALGVSHAAIDRVCSVTAEYGFVSKLTGAGGGGCVITLLRPDHDSQQIENVKTQLSSLSFEVLQTSLGAIGIALHQAGHSAELPPSMKQLFA